MYVAFVFDTVDRVQLSNEHRPMIAQMSLEGVQHEKATTITSFNRSTSK
jgi:hypothetical protein